MARMAFILLCVFLLGGTAMVREIDVDGVPLPDDAVVRPSTSPMPTDHGEFTGAWVGAWGGLLRHILVVEDIRANGVASVIYAIGGNPAWGIKRAWHRTTAKIEAG